MKGPAGKKVGSFADANGLIILGGGLAGLTASMYTGAPVFEADSRPGGVAASDRIDGFAFDRGIHILQTRNVGILKLLDDLGVKFHIHNRVACIYSHKRYTAFPFQINTAGLPIGLRARCVWHFFRRPRTSRPSNYEEWIYANLGAGFGETFLIPYSEKFWTIPPREMTYEWTGSRVPQPSAWQVVRGALWDRQTPVGSNATFRYPIAEVGYGAIADALAKRAGPIYTGCRAVELHTSAKLIRFSNGGSVRYETLINTIPLPELIGICKDAPESVHHAASQLRTNSILVVNLGIGKPNVSGRHWVHFPEKDVSFFRISYPHNFTAGVAPKGTSSLSAEVSYVPGKPPNREEMIERVIDDLVRVEALGRRDPIVVKTTFNIRYAYCIYDFNRREALRIILGWLRKQGIISCGRYGLWTYFWSDESILSGKKAAELAQQLAGSPVASSAP